VQLEQRIGITANLADAWLLPRTSRDDVEGASAPKSLQAFVPAAQSLGFFRISPEGNSNLRVRVQRLASGRSASMKKDWELTQEAFDQLLNWLDSDREEAGRKYEAIRLRLIKIFTCRGCSEAEELADETINRVAARLDNLEWKDDGDRARYFYAVAQKVYLEYLRNCKKRHAEISLDSGAETSIASNSGTDEIEFEYACLERCLEHLPTNSRRLVLEYYHQERKAKIDHRKMLAEELGIAVNALRIRAHRIRLALERCMYDCLEEQPVH